MSLVEKFPVRIESFIKAANKNHLKIILVGGGVVNFHGYQRHSTDLDFWIDIQEENLKNLLLTLSELNYLYSIQIGTRKIGFNNLEIIS